MTEVERAARALCENPSEDPDKIIEMSDGSHIPRWRAEVWRVEAVLQALREPSEGLVTAGAGELVFDAELDRREVTEDIWRAMIDAALAEKPE